MNSVTAGDAELNTQLIAISTSLQAGLVRSTRNAHARGVVFWLCRRALFATTRDEGSTDASIADWDETKRTISRLNCICVFYRPVTDARV